MFVGTLRLGTGHPHSALRTPHRALLPARKGCGIESSSPRQRPGRFLPRLRASIPPSGQAGNLPLRPQPPRFSAALPGLDSFRAGMAHRRGDTAPFRRSAGAFRRCKAIFRRWFAHFRRSFPAFCRGRWRPARGGGCRRLRGLRNNQSLQHQCLGAIDQQPDADEWASPTRGLRCAVSAAALLPCDRAVRFGGRV